VALSGRPRPSAGAAFFDLDRKLISRPTPLALAATFRRRAAGIELEVRTGYSDPHTDLAFLETVGVAVAVNPDRRLRRIASGRGGPILRFETLFQPPSN